MLTERLRKGVRYGASAVFLLNLLTAQAGPSPGAPIALIWTPSSDPTVAGYNVYYGTASRNYTNVVPVGSLTTTTVSNLLAGTTYYFAATSYTAAGLESDFSTEASYAVPTNAILRAAASTSQARSLTILGLVGNTYQVQYTTNLGPSAVWSPLSTYSLTNFSQTISVDPTVPQIFYRVQQK